MNSVGGVDGDDGSDYDDTSPLLPNCPAREERTMDIFVSRMWLLWLRMKQKNGRECIGLESKDAATFVNWIRKSAQELFLDQFFGNIFLTTRVAKSSWYNVDFLAIQLRKEEDDGSISISDIGNCNVGWFITESDDDELVKLFLVKIISVWNALPRDRQQFHQWKRQIWRKFYEPAL